ncbi:MAG: hypothetical protein OEU09_18710 [Rhodospirillales bacterium]|nr:hypothetical protein [Rhodospirillales bacterium]MDH3793105.1 hypothetical protein [Rhodospirillales bacterium]MDH3913317.1 hypothetical protein [Rhodospirillales bacterium]MDH3918764.1 hypothetical protein [Rhodospirillales bacterium]MDH3969617.1 hypothetical protein [Rhodospirillales bacterium]
MDGHPAGQSTAELEALRGETDRFLTKRLVLWAIRWIIGFAIIAAVDYFFDGVGWLWWAGGALAATTLILMLVMHWIMARKYAEVQGKLDELNDAIRASGED